MTIDGLIFDNFSFSSFLSMAVCVRANASVLPGISDDVVMHELLKEGIF